MSKDTGGPAFPKVSDDGYPASSPMGVGYLGMTLRDYFAAKAMQAIIIGNRADAASIGSGTALDAFNMADFMLAERNK